MQGSHSELGQEDGRGDAGEGKPAAGASALLCLKLSVPAGYRCAPALHRMLACRTTSCNDLIIVQVGDTLEEFLVEATSDAKLRQTVMSLSEAVRTIAFKARKFAAAL